MRITILCVVVGLGLLSMIAHFIQPRETNTGKTPLVWTSDDNPARRAQVALFNKQHPEYDLRLDPANNAQNNLPPPTPKARYN